MHNAISDKPIAYSSLDVILGVGYRTNSKLAISFRQWATKTLRTHILTDYTINKKMISKNYKKFLQAVEEVKRLLPVNNDVTSNDTLELIKLFASTWFSLDAYDKSTMPKEGATLKEVTLTIEQVESTLREFWQALITYQIASELFGTERENGGIASIESRSSSLLHDQKSSFEKRERQLLENQQTIAQKTYSLGQKVMYRVNFLSHSDLLIPILKSLQ